MKKACISVVFAVVFFLSLVSVFSFSDFLGIHARVVDSTHITNTLACNDSDGGVFSFQKGIVTTKNFFGIPTKYIDRCQDVDGKDAVKEFYCDAGKAKWQKIVCENGCEGVACLKKTEIPLQSCTEITQEGTYYLTASLKTTQDDCIHIHHVKNVAFDCKGFSIFNDKTSIILNHVNNFSIQHCILRMNSTDINLSDYYIGNAVEIKNSHTGVFKNNEVRDQSIQVSASSFLSFINNSFDVYNQDATNYSRIEENTMPCGEICKKTSSNGPSWNIGSTYGHDNTIIHNRINGGSDGVYSTRIGPDDGIVIQDEFNDLISGNIVQNHWDCSIETLGVISSTIVENNVLSNAPYCGIGGWHYSSLLNTTFRNNVFTAYDHRDSLAPLFSFFRIHPLRENEGEHVMYFANNSFINNSIHYVFRPGSEDLIALPSSFTFFDNVEVPPAKMILQGNLFQNNDFGKLSRAPTFYPPEMVVDGKGNRCKAPLEPDYPLTCS